MRCPECRDEFEDAVVRCSECDVELVGDGVALPPRVDARLGTFHPTAAEPVIGLLRSRRIAHEVVENDDLVEVMVDRAYRDDLRAELALNWTELVASLPEEEMYEVLASGSHQPGWVDAPQGAWIDRHGRIQVEAHVEEEREADARRTLGPTLLVLGAILVIFGWYAGGDLREVTVLTGFGMLVVGLFVPR